MAAITTKQLVKEFPGGVLAVDGLDLTVETGEVVAVLGPTGAGKTTLLDMVLGLAVPSAGTVEVLGLSPRKAVAAGRISAVLQTGGLLRDLTVRETVQMIASTFPEHADIEEVLGRAGLTAIARRRVAKCSGGEQQRLRFALALLPDPELLVLDEPTAGMDVTARREFWAAMHAEAAQGRTVLFATHYLAEADDFADRIVVLDRGRVIADGSTAEIRANAADSTVSAVLPGDPGPLPGALDVRRRNGRLVVRGTDSDAVARALLDRGATDLLISEADLEEAFVALVRPAGSTTKEAPR
jgi:ABC-2 type transport system ATP-binding protein